MNTTYVTVMDFILNLPPDSRAIEAVQCLLEDEILQQLAFMTANFKVLKQAITQLVERQLLTESVGIVRKVQDSITVQPFKTKLQSVLEKNSGFLKLAQMADVLSGV